MLKINLFILLVVSLVTFNVQASEDSNDFWLGTFTKKTLNDSYSLWTEAQLRFDLDENEMQQTLVRTGLLKTINDKSGAGLLYAYINTGQSDEHRLALQHTQKYGALALNIQFSHRVRLEARRFENIGFSSGRLRYLLRAQSSKSKAWSRVIWNEAFLNMRRESMTGTRHFDRNRLFLGFRKNFEKAKLSIEFGYLNQFVPRANGDSMEHTLVFYTFL